MGCCLARQLCYRTVVRRSILDAERIRAVPSAELEAATGLTRCDRPPVPHRAPPQPALIRATRCTKPARSQRSRARRASPTRRTLHGRLRRPSDLPPDAIGRWGVRSMSPRAAVHYEHGEEAHRRGDQGAESAAHE